MFGKKKKDQEIVEKEEKVNNEEIIDDEIDATDSAVEMPEKKPDLVINLDETPKKKRKILGAWETFNVYKFIIEIIATVLLIALGFVILFNKEEAMFAIFIITGGVPLISIIIKTIILIIKRKEIDKKLIRLYIIEFVIEFVLGIAMVLAASMCIASKSEDADTSIKIRDWFDDTYPFFVAGIFYVASISYFIRTILHNVYTDRVRFWMNIVFITGALIVLCFKDNITAWVVAIIIAVLSFLSAVVLGTDAGGGYYNYNKRNKAKKEKENLEEDNIKKAPEAENIIDTDYTDIDKRDSNIIS